jgi:nicotinamidase-related amidase
MPKGTMEVTWARNQEIQIMRIAKESCIAVVIDIQEKLFPHMDGHEDLLKRCLTLLKGFNVLDIPILLTEQYPKGLGSTLPQITNELKGIAPVEKIAFSCCDEKNFKTRLEESGATQVIICGIEAHVCVLQTVIDLTQMGLVPVVVADCISSRNPLDKEIAIERMRAEGALITTSESILFELARVAGTEQFKKISNLVK